MPRKISGVNNLPVAVFPDDDEVRGYDVLAAWGVRAWNRNFPSQVGDYIGWQRVILPDGWRLSLEGHDFYLLDESNQIRGVIEEALKTPPRPSIKSNLSDKDRYGDIMTPEEIAVLKEKMRKYREAKPRLVLRRSLKSGSSFGLGEFGPYSYWIENALGERVFGIFDEEVSDDEADARLPVLAQKVYDWRDENYPDWQNFEAYWDVFVGEEAENALTDREVVVMACHLLSGKSNEKLAHLHKEIGTGEKRTEFILELQKQLPKKVGVSPARFPFRVVSNITWNMRWRIEHHLGINR